jgi:hypothetical protein
VWGSAPAIFRPAPDPPAHTTTAPNSTRIPGPIPLPAAWLSEVVNVVFILVPTAIRLKGRERASHIFNTFPRVFKVASALSAVTLAAGAWLNYLITGWHDLDAYISSLGGRAILLGRLLGLLIALFH